ncbi:hypothetical protein D3C87_1330090 [compost metagenome]
MTPWAIAQSITGFAVNICTAMSWPTVIADVLAYSMTCPKVILADAPGASCSIRATPMRSITQVWELQTRLSGRFLTKNSGARPASKTRAKAGAVPAPALPVLIRCFSSSLITSEGFADQFASWVR